MNCQFDIGQCVKDSYTGMIGHVTAIHFDANGCQLTVESVHDGLLRRNVFEEARLECAEIVLATDDESQAA